MRKKSKILATLVVLGTMLYSADCAQLEHGISEELNRGIESRLRQCGVKPGRQTKEQYVSANVGASVDILHRKLNGVNEHGLPVMLSLREGLRQGLGQYDVLLRHVGQFITSLGLNGEMSYLKQLVIREAIKYLPLYGYGQKEKLVADQLIGLERELGRECTIQVAGTVAPKTKHWFEKLDVQTEYLGRLYAGSSNFSGDNAVVKDLIEDRTEILRRILLSGKLKGTECVREKEGSRVLVPIYGCFTPSTSASWLYVKDCFPNSSVVQREYLTWNDSQLTVMKDESYVPELDRVERFEMIDSRQPWEKAVLRLMNALDLRELIMLAESRMTGVHDEYNILVLKALIRFWSGTEDEKRAAKSELEGLLVEEYDQRRKVLSDEVDGCWRRLAEAVHEGAREEAIYGLLLEWLRTKMGGFYCFRHINLILSTSVIQTEAIARQMAAQIYPRLSGNQNDVESIMSMGAWRILAHNELIARLGGNPVFGNPIMELGIKQRTEDYTYWQELRNRALAIFEESDVYKQKDQWMELIKLHGEGDAPEFAELRKKDGTLDYEMSFIKFNELLRSIGIRVERKMADKINGVLSNNSELPSWYCVELRQLAMQMNFDAGWGTRLILRAMAAVLLANSQ
ncbi:MAG: hypothetical protein LBT03_01470 [Holosporales bacterium]|jgi:hypothetical protein|nr:hypothetical protein [Holosporales bacterium]